METRMQIVEYMARIVVFSILIALLSACGGGGSTGSNSDKTTGYFKEVKGLYYRTSDGQSGLTPEDGAFIYSPGNDITFYAGDIELGTVKASPEISIFSFSKPDMVAQTLHALDEDANPDNGITIPAKLQNNSIATNKKTDRASTIKLENISVYSDQYIQFLYNKGILVENSKRALLREIAKHLEYPTPPQKNFIDQIMVGAYKPPLDRFNNEEQITKNIKERDDYFYKVNLVTLHQMLMEISRSQENDSNTLLLDAETYEKEIQNRQQEIMFAVDTAINSVNAIASYPDSMTKSMITYLKSESKSSADFMIESQLPEEMTTDAKLATTIVYDCSIEENPEECALNVLDNRLDQLIETKLSDRYPYASIWIKGIKDIAKQDYEVGRSCKKASKGPKEMIECIGKATKAIVNNMYSLVGETMKIYHLGEDSTELNSKAIAYDIFLSSKYLDKKAFTIKRDSYCSLSEYYGGEYEVCKNHAHYIDNLDALVKMVIASGKVKELISGIFNTSANYNIQTIEKTLLQLENRYNTLFRSFEKSLKRYKSAGQINQQAVDQWVYTRVHIDPPNVEILSQNGETVDLRACFQVYSSRAIDNVIASISIVSDNGMEYIFPQYEFQQNGAFKGNRTFCGKLQEYKPIKKGDENLPAVVTSRMRFHFTNTTGKEFDISNFNLYNWHYQEEEPFKSEIDFTHPYDPEQKAYLLQATLTDIDTDSNYVYYWNIESDLQQCRIGNSNKNTDFFIYKVPSICHDATLLATLQVYDENGNLLGIKEHLLDPIQTINDSRITVGASPSLIELHTGENANIKLRISGGKPPYSVDTSLDNTFFSVSHESVSEIQITSRKVAEKKERAVLYITVSDSAGKQSSITVSLYQNPPLPDEPLTIATSRKLKKPYSAYPDQWSEKEPNSSFVQQWWLQNSSSQTLYNITMRLSDFCDSNLEHPREDILIGNLRPGEIVNPQPSLAITGGGINGQYNYCQWDLFAKDAQGKEQRLRWNKSGKSASLNYYILSKTQKDIRPPIITDFKSRFENGKVTGSFNIEHPSGLVTHLRLYFSPFRYFPTDRTYLLDIGGAYDSLQNTGIKNFEFSLPDWPNRSLFMKLEATNKDNTPLATTLVRGLHLIGYKVPEVSSISPTQTIVDKATTFTIQGTNLPSTLAMSLQDAICSEVTIISNSEATITCTPKKEGKKRFYVATRPNGKEIKGGEQLYITISKSAPPTKPSLSSILVGKTLYQYCQTNQKLYSFTFDSNGILKISDGIQAKEYAYHISNSWLYITNNDKKVSEKLLSHSDKYLKFGTSIDKTYFFHPADAKISPRTDCEKEDEGEKEDEETLSKVRIHLLPQKATSSTLKISWERVDSSSDDKTIYELAVAKTPSFSDAQIYNAGKNLTYQVDSLQDSTKYYFRVRAKNAQATGPWSDTTSIFIDLQNTPQFGSYHRPQNDSINVEKNPKFEWGATDSDGDDLEYYFELGTSENNLVYNSGWITKNHIYWNEISNNDLNPNTTYYWHVLVRESGRDKTYYGGSYPVSPLWSFTTVAKGPDLSIKSVNLLDPIKPDHKVRVKVGIKNRGTKTIENFYIRLRYKKNGSINDFATEPMQLIDTQLAPGQETEVVLTADFRNELIQRNGKTYDNILIEGESFLVIDLPYSDNDINPKDNSIEYKITYADQGKPRFSYLYVGHQSLYTENKIYGTLGSILGGESQGITFSVEDDMQVTEAKVYYRLSSDDSWHLIQSFTSNKDHISEMVKWTIPENQGYLTDSLQIKVTATDNNGNFSESISHPLPVYDNHLAITTSPISTHQIGERFTLPLQIDHRYEIDLIEIELKANGYDSILYTKADTSGFTPPESIMLTLPSKNKFADDSAKLEIRVSDIHGNSVTKEFSFNLKPNLDTGDIFGNMITIYNEEYPDFPADSRNQRTENSIKKVILDENNIAHILVESTGWWRKNGENQMSRHIRNFYVTYNFTTKQRSAAQMLFDIRQINNGNMPDEYYKDFIVTPDGTPLMVTYNSRTKTLRSHTLSGHKELFSASEGKSIDTFKLINHYGKTYLTYRSITSDKSLKRSYAMEIYPKVGTPNMIADGYYGKEMRLHGDTIYFPYTGKAFHVDTNLIATSQLFDTGQQNIVVYGDVFSYNSSYIDLQFDNSHRIQLLKSNGETKTLVQIENDDVLASYQDRTKIDAAITDGYLLYTYSYRPDPNNSSRSFRILQVGFDGTVQKVIDAGTMMDYTLIKDLVSINKNGIVAIANPDKGAAYLLIGDFSH